MNEETRENIETIMHIMFVLALIISMGFCCYWLYDGLEEGKIIRATAMTRSQNIESGFIKCFLNEKHVNCSEMSPSMIDHFQINETTIWWNGNPPKKEKT